MANRGTGKIVRLLSLRWLTNHVEEDFWSATSLTLLSIHFFRLRLILSANKPRYLAIIGVLLDYDRILLTGYLNFLHLLRVLLLAQTNSLELILNLSHTFWDRRLNLENLPRLLYHWITNSLLPLLLLLLIWSIYIRVSFFFHLVCNLIDHLLCDRLHLLDIFFLIEELQQQTLCLNHMILHTHVRF